ncbi:MAG: SPASM domain-containing protein [Pseudobdellovibrio sp.]
MSKDLIVYLKTTDTCQLNCDHCFTNGSSGKKGWFDVKQTINFFHELKKYRKVYDSGHFSFHGGEPMLCPTEHMFEFYYGVRDLWPALWWSVQTNLTYKLTEDKMSVFEKICNKSFGTSWDYGIRWKNETQKKLWQWNVKELTSDGYDLTVMVSLNKRLIEEKEPIEIINELAELGVKHVNFERLTPNGNALINNTIFPTNKELDQWFMKMWDQTLEHKTWNYIDNMFLDSLLTSYVYNTHSGCRSRQCEQKIFTLNADGTVGGCPNDAPNKHYGTIYEPIENILFSNNRMCNINHESLRHPVCAACPVYDICNGDCHQLSWQGDVCAAPKSLMIHLRELNNQPLYKDIMGQFMGQE